jgi:hypothetical protein
MKNKLAALAAIGLLAALTTTAQAVQIQGSVAFKGTPTLVGSTLFTTADKITFSDIEVNAGEALGDYLPADGHSFAGGDAFGPIDINPVALPFALWSFEVGGVTYSFRAESLDPALTLVAPRAIMLAGTGTASIEGFEDTPGTWIFQANKSGSSFSFASSAEVNPVPDGGLTLMLLGGAMSVLAVVRRKLS